MFVASCVNIFNFLRIDMLNGYTYDLVEQANALHAFVDVFRVKLSKVWYAGKHDTDIVFGLRVEFLLCETKRWKH